MARATLNKKVPIWGLLVGALAIYPAAGQALPSWVEQPPQQPGTAFGVGSAEVYADPANALSRAKDAARVELVKTLRVKVEGETRTKQRRERSGGETKVTQSFMRKVRNRVPEVELANIEIAETHVDEDEGNAFALARLDRKAEAQRLSERIARIDEELEGYDTGEKKGNRLERIRSLLPALERIEERRKLIDKLRLVAPQEASYDVDPQRFASLENELLELVGQLRIVLDPEGKGSRQMETTLRKALTEKGMKVRRSGERDLALRYRLSFESAKKDSYFVFARGSVSVLDQDGRILDEFRADVKGVSTRKNVARDRAVENLANKLADRVAASLLGGV